ncbi:conserved protein, unknown function, partial [Hepatocystis sp. ex Piliocolobus tephrosceles]
TYEEVVELKKNLKSFRSLKFDNLNYHSDKCILARSLVHIYIYSYKKHIESLTDTNVQLVIKLIKRTVLNINNLICNITEQTLKCFLILKNLYNDVVKLNIQHLADYCVFSVLDGILNILDDAKHHSNGSTVWGLASFLSLVMSNFNRAFFFYKGLMSYKCMYTVPLFIDNEVLQNMSKEELHNLILKENDEFLPANFSRIEGYVKLHVSVFVVLNDTREVWAYIAEIVNSANRKRTYVYFCIIYAILAVSNYYCKLTYGNYFEHFLILLKVKLMPILIHELKKNPPPPSVERHIEYYIQKINVEYLNDNIKCSMPEDILIIPDEKLLYLQ